MKLLGRFRLFRRLFPSQEEWCEKGKHDWWITEYAAGYIKQCGACGAKGGSVPPWEVPRPEYRVHKKK